MTQMNGRQISMDAGQKDLAFRISVLSAGSFSKSLLVLSRKSGMQTESWQDRIIKTERCPSVSFRPAMILSFLVAAAGVVFSRGQLRFSGLVSVFMD
jgi:hypothetical protein